MNKLTSEEYKARLLEIMCKVDNACRENDIRYTIAYGTLLGAVRHQGFIPWDDDVDLLVTREEYARLRELIAARPELGLTFIDLSTHRDTIYVCGKICDRETVVKESSFRPVEDYGAFVDVFPLDNIPDDELERKHFKAHARYLAKLIQHSAKLKPGKPQNLKHAFLLYAAFAYSHCFSTEKLIRELDGYCQKYKDTQTSYWGNPYLISYLKKADFDELVDLPFEGLMLPAPKNYDSVLSDCYGDYRQLPPPEQRTNHWVECYWKE